MGQNFLDLQHECIYRYSGELKTVNTVLRKIQEIEQEFDLGRICLGAKFLYVRDCPFVSHSVSQ